MRVFIDGKETVTIDATGLRVDGVVYYEPQPAAASRISEIRTQTRPPGPEHRKPAGNKEPDSSRRGDNRAGNIHNHNCSNPGNSSPDRSCSTRDDGVCRLPGPEWLTARTWKQPRVAPEDIVSSSY